MSEKTEIGGDVSDFYDIKSTEEEAVNADDIHDLEGRDLTGVRDEEKVVNTLINSGESRFIKNHCLILYYAHAYSKPVYFIL